MSESDPEKQPNVVEQAPTAPVANPTVAEDDSEGATSKWALALGVLVLLGFAGFGVLRPMLHTKPDSTTATPVAPTPGPTAPGATQPSANSTQEGFAAMQKGSVDEALKLFEAGMRADPNDAGAVFGIGWAYQTKGDLIRAEARYREAAVIAGRTGNIEIEFFTTYNLGDLFMTQSHPDVAAAEFRHAVSLTEGNPKSFTDRAWSAWYNLGRALSQAGRPGEAIEPLVRAAKLKPQDASIQFELGVAAAKAGNAAQSKAALDEAVRLNPALAATAQRVRDGNAAHAVTPK